ncbi:MAG: hypothetical protein JXA96_06790 [Sedimentisphaerales bacterium]|nr:hypothetical protein [Sedimentisphaerales bacterium]
MNFLEKFADDWNNARQYKMTFSEALWCLLFVFYIASVWLSGIFFSSKYPQIDHFFETHPFLTILTGIVFLMGIPALFALFILKLKDRKKSRCPRCKTKYKKGNMEFGQGKIISTFICKKCGYENKITERFNLKKVERMFGDPVDSGKFPAEEVRELEELSKLYDKNLNKQE